MAGESTVRDYLRLLKPGVMSLVVFSGWVGMAVAPGTLHPFLQLVTLLCIAVGSGASGAINMWYDRDIDAHMRRTQYRPIPQGRIAPADALAFGVVLAIAAVAFLGLAVNWLAAALLALAVLFYVCVYTLWLKRRTPQNIVIGGAAGALPPMIGWAATTGAVSWESFALFMIIFLWTPPHFWALSVYRHDDYAKVGIPMLPVVAGVAHTKYAMLVYTLLLAVATAVPVMQGLGGWLYALTAFILNGTFLFHAVRVWRSDNVHYAKSMFLFSLAYLFVLFAALWLDVRYIP